MYKSDVIGIPLGDFVVICTVHYPNYNAYKFFCTSRHLQAQTDLMSSQNRRDSYFNLLRNTRAMNGTINRIPSVNITVSECIQTD